MLTTSKFSEGPVNSQPDFGVCHPDRIQATRFAYPNRLMSPVEFQYKERAEAILSQMRRRRILQRQIWIKSADQGGVKKAAGDSRPRKDILLAGIRPCGTGRCPRQDRPCC
ncbi:MAG: hypothetical protein ACNA7E_01260, partial [Wenzhouxiangellaceae bacterium]